MQSRTSMLLAALAAAVAAGPALAAQHEHKADVPSAKSEHPVTDTWITTKVKTDLMASDGVPGTEISVDTKNGTVWLSGDVKTTAERDRAIAKVVVARPLTDEQAAALRSALSRQLGREIALQVSIQPEVLGGVRVSVGDEVIEGTVAGRLTDAARHIS